MGVDHQEMMIHGPAYMRKILKGLGINVDAQNFRDTPDRFVKFLQDFVVPYDPQNDLGRAFDEPVKDIYDHAIVVQTGIPYHAVCAHHLLPVLGVAHVGYIPCKKVVGLSKLSRLVRGITHRMPSLQEDVGNEVVDALMNILGAAGAICVIKAEHGCMAARGVAAPTGQVKTVTSSIRGIFIDKAMARAEFYHLVRQGEI